MFLGACLVAGKFMIVTELVKGGELSDLLYNKKIDISLYQRYIIILTTINIYVL